MKDSNRITINCSKLMSCITEDAISLNKSKFPIIDISFDNFRKLLSAEYRLQELQAFNDNRLKIDKNNQLQIEILFKWVTGEVSNSKGILFIGGYGTGKTSVINAFLKMYRKIAKVQYNYYHSFDLAENLKHREFTNFKGCITFLNDIGKEGEKIFDYGNVNDVMNLFLQEAERALHLFATSNLNIESLKKI